MVVRQTRALKRSAFTLVELLVVISIIGVLMALLLPAVNAARAAMWKAECANNIKQLTTATTNWSAAKQMRLPGYAEPVGGKRMPWPVALMPYMEQQQLYDKFRVANFATALQMSDTIDPIDPLAVTIPNFVCTADGNKGALTGAQMSYVANVGMAGTNWTTYPPQLYKANGVFQNAELLAGTGPGAPSPQDGVDKVTLNMSGITDGAGQTVAFSENVQAVTYGLPPAYTADPTDLTEEQRFRLSAGFQWLQNPTAADLAIASINGGFKDPTLSVYANPLAARPSSFHAGGVNMGFLDGHIQFVPTASIDYVVYKQLMTPDSAKSDMPPLEKSRTIPWEDIN